MKTVKQLLAEKAGAPVTVSPDTKVFDALKLMAEKNVGSVLVVVQGKLVGIMSERDYARKVTLFGKSSKELAVQAIMTEKVFYVTPSQTVPECMAVMTDKHIRHLPVLDGDRIVGVVSIGDVVKETISEQQFIIQQLEHYISS